MPERSPNKPIPLAGKARRLKSLNEFEPPYWLGLFKAPRAAKFWPLVLITVGVGAMLGWFVF